MIFDLELQFNHQNDHNNAHIPSLYVYVKIPYAKKSAKSEKLTNFVWFSGGGDTEDPAGVQIRVRAGARHAPPVGAEVSRPGHR